ncbi:MAG: hypothetical protein mread185_000146 [Mycoplasmataceae bacterium]|nr:MAG: hypothetical protein mread185_000146 [Mycoplasmataceae bacterium]
MTNKFPPVHPGQTLERQFFQPLNLSKEQLSQDLHLPTYQLQDLVEGKAKITPEIAYRLSCYFQIEPELFLNLQQRYDLELWKDRQETHIKRQVKSYQEKYSASIH